MIVLPIGQIVLGKDGSSTAFNEVLQEVQQNGFSGYLEVRMKIRGGELWGVVIFEQGRLVESYANKMGADIFGETAYLHIMEISMEPMTALVLHQLDPYNLIDKILSGRGRKIKVENVSMEIGTKTIPGFGTADEEAAQASPATALPDDGKVKKVVLLGDPAVGKTSTVRRFVENTFNESYLSTIGSNVNKKTLTIRDGNDAPVNLTMIIWDIAGDKACDSLKRAYYRGAEAAIVVCDITIANSFEHIPEWIETLYEITGEVPIVLLGNKSDLDDFRQVDMVELHDLASSYGANAYPTSARTGKNVEMVFDEIAHALVAK